MGITANGNGVSVANGPETAASLLAAGLDARAAELVSFHFAPFKFFFLNLSLSFFLFFLIICKFMHFSRFSLNNKKKNADKEGGRERKGSGVN